MTDLASVLDALEHHGMLLKQDITLPSVVGLITCESLRGSWWGHPRAHEIFAVLNELADHPDVLFTKLLSRKDTLVHRRLWPDVLAVGSARAAWQTEDLSAESLKLLARVQGSAVPVRSSGAAAKQLQHRLLVVAQEVHTETGRHAMALESWASWSAHVGCSAGRSEGDARVYLQSIALSLGASGRALPWNS
jgi:hypothetical protein